MSPTSASRGHPGDDLAADSSGGGAEATARRTAAAEAIAQRFTRIMNATPSRFGVLSDVTLAATSTGIVVMVGLIAASQLDRPATAAPFIAALSAVPIVVSACAARVLRRSRADVIDWLVGVPFPIENLNALLAGMGDTIEVSFARGATLPGRPELQPALDAVSEEALLVSEKPDQNLVEIRLGVIDSKRNPLASNHRRWRRLQEIVARVLVPLSERAPIERVRVV